MGYGLDVYKTRWSSTVFPHPMTTDPSRTPAPARSALEFAALLPPEYRGFYAEHARLKQLLGEEEQVPG